jgi:hypothetical protein
MTKRQSELPHESTPHQPTIEEMDTAYAEAARGQAGCLPAVMFTTKGILLLNDTNDYELIPWLQRD